MAGPNVVAIAADPKFQALPESDRYAILGQLDSNFAGLPDADKPQVLNSLQRSAVTRPDLAAPPGVPRPQVNMQTSLLGLLQGSPDSTPPVSKVPPSIQKAPDWVGEAITGATVGGPALMAPGVARVATAGVRMAPYIAASEAINYARRELPFGKYIPAYAELLPWFMGGKGAAEGEATARPPKDAGDPFRDVPKPPPPDVFNVKEPPPATMPRPAETPAPYRYGPGEIAPEEVGVTPNARVLAGGKGMITTPRGALPPAPGEPYAELLAPERPPAVYNAPYTYSGESALRQVLTGLGNKELLQIAKSRGLNVAAEAQLKPGVADSRLIKKIIDDFSPDELDEMQARFLETRRMGYPAGISPEADNVATMQTYFPDLKIPATKLNRMRQSFATRSSTLYDLLTQPAGAK